MAEEYVYVRVPRCMLDKDDQLEPDVLQLVSGDNLIHAAVRFDGMLLLAYNVDAPDADVLPEIRDPKGTVY